MPHRLEEANYWTDTDQQLCFYFIDGDDDKELVTCTNSSDTGFISNKQRFIGIKGAFSIPNDRKEKDYACFEID